jgi:hypothetical protein
MFEDKVTHQRMESCEGFTITPLKQAGRQAYTSIPRDVREKPKDVEVPLCADKSASKARKLSGEEGSTMKALTSRSCNPERAQLV